MGRNAAGESFLKGFLKYSATSEYWALISNSKYESNFSNTVKEYGSSFPVNIINKHNLGKLSEPGCIYFPGPSIAELANHRGLHGSNAWSICGITHTTSSAGAMDALSALITAPIQPWDSIICTSNAVKTNVTSILQANVDYLKERLGITKIVLPQLPVIPLGIDCQAFEFSAEEKAQSRKKIGALPEEIVVLFMGRLSFHAKAHPLAMYQALEKASQKTGKNIKLIECGWHANDFIRDSFLEAAKKACPSVKVINLDGRSHAHRQTAWAAADIFCSLSDNIQETFGITPVEAMASGLPVVVSDWDGYKDTVRDGIDGFRVPTLMPQGGLGGDFAYRHALEIDTYDMYCGYTAMLIAVDIEATTEGFVRLIESPELRRKMGAAGKERAKSLYDWKVIIGRYEEHWASLNEIRISNLEVRKTLQQAWAARMDPFLSFANYPTQTLTPETRLKQSEDALETGRIQKLDYLKLKMVEFSKVLIPSDEELGIIFEQLNFDPTGVRAADLVSKIPENRRPYALRALVLLVKIGILKVA